jgi:hypothetical protein
VEKGRGLNEKWLEYLVSKLFSNRKHRGLGLWCMDQRRAWSMVDRPAMELTRARPSSRSGPRRLAARWGKEGGRNGESILASTEAWKVARRQRTSGGTLAWKGDGVGTVGTKRRRVGGVGIFIGGEATFYRSEVRWERPGAFNAHGLKVLITGGLRMVGGDGLRALLRCGRRKKEVGWAKRPNGPASYWAESQGKFLSEIKYDF